MSGPALIDLALAALLDEGGAGVEATSAPLAGAAELRRRADERWDDAGEAIPLGARVLAACRLAVDGGSEQLREGAGTRFDPSVVAAFGVTGS
jgi:response regulator RpfG family c-di-GMP phosphodiesterase